jgi:hypothetical protein
MTVGFEFYAEMQVDIGKWGGYCIINKAVNDEVYEIVSYRYNSVMCNGAALASSEYVSKEKLIRLGFAKVESSK